MQTQVLKTADGFKTEVTLRSIVRAPFYKHGKEDEEILELILLAEKGDRVVFEFQQGEEKRCYVKDFINQTAHRKQLLRG